MYLTDLLSLIVAVVFWCDMLGGILCWQDSLWWSGPTHNDPTTGEWKKTRQTLKCSLLRGNVSYNLILPLSSFVPMRTLKNISESSEIEIGKCFTY